MNRITLIVLTMFVAVGAFAGGVGLITESVEMDPELLHGTLFGSYVVPGYILAIVVGGSNLLAGVMLLMHHRFGVHMAMIAGAILTGWIAVQVAMIGYATLLQPIYFALGIITMAFARRFWLERTEAGAA